MKTLRDDKKGRHFFHLCLKVICLLVAIFVLLFAVLVTITRISSPFFNRHLHHIEALVSQAVGQPVTVKKIDLWWHGVSPVIELESVNVGSSLHAQEIRLSVDLFDSLWHRQFRVNHIDLKGGRYHLTMLPDHRFKINGLVFSESAGSQSDWTQLLSGIDTVALRQVALSFTNTANKTVSATIEDAKCWLHWSGAQLQSLSTNLALAQLSLYGKTDHALHDISLSGHWQQRDEDWVLLVNHFEMTFHHHHWPADDILIRHQQYHTTVSAAYLSLDDLHHLLSRGDLLPGNVQKQLSALQPSGVLRQFYLSHTGAQWGLRSFALSANLENVSVNAFGSVPGVHHVTGQVYWRKGTGQFFMNARHVTFNDPRLFLSPLTFDTAYVNAQWHWPANQSPVITFKQVLLHNAQLSAQASGQVRLSAKTAPNIQLLYAMHLANAKRLYHYLPVKVMGQDTAAWFKQAFLNGKVDGGVILDGNMADFPFEQTPGTFLSDLTVQHLVCQYSPVWPALHAKQVSIHFVGKRMSVYTRKAQVRDVVTGPVKLEIPSIVTSNPSLWLQVGAKANLTQFQDILQHSSLNQRIAKPLKALQLRGPATLALQLNLPLNQTIDAKVYGDVLFQKDALSVLHQPNAISNLSGHLQFTQNSVTAPHLQALALGHPANMIAKTNTRPNGDKIFSVRLRSQLTGKQFAQLLHLPIAAQLSGIFSYKAYVNQPLITREKTSGVTVQLHSNLKGLTMRLPGDFKKSAADSLPLSVQFHLFNKRFSTLKARLATRANLEMDTISLPHPKAGLTPGYALTANLQQFHWVTWQAFLKKLPKQAGVAKASDRVSHYQRNIVSIDVRVGALQAFGETFQQAHVTLQPNQSKWQLNFNSGKASGSTLNTEHIKAQAEFTWPADVEKSLLSELSGQFSITLGPGNIASIGKDAQTKLEFGRLLNALSLRSLLQKLTVHDADYRQGYHFTAMQGDFALHHGQLSTHNATFKGSVATVAFTGNIDLVKHRLDLILTVQPHVTGSVPVVAGLLINPAVGVAAWFANLLVSPAVSKATEQHFQLSGSWKKPVIVSLGKTTDRKHDDNAH